MNEESLSKRILLAIKQFKSIIEDYRKDDRYIVDNEEKEILEEIEKVFVSTYDVYYELLQRFKMRSKDEE